MSGISLSGSDVPSSSSTSSTWLNETSSSYTTLGSVSTSPTTESFRASATPFTLPEERRQLSVAYTAAEAIVSFLAIFGNALVAYVFCTNRTLRRYRNYYIFALAIADFLVGLLGIPFAVLASVGLPRNLYGCLFTVSVLVVLCTISILCLVAVSIDRYWATTNPFAYYRHMTTSTAVGIILCCWIVGAIIGFLPLFGWYNLDGWMKTEYCFFTEVIDYNYLVFLYFSTIVFPAILMAGFYGYIYHVVLIKIRQKGNLVPQIRRPSEQSRSGSLNSDQRGASQILKIIVSEKRREAKAAHKLGIIVLFFMICWMPLYTINCIQAFCPECMVPIELLNFTIILSHANSSLNPILYAYHLKEFRIAMKNALLVLFEKMVCGLIKTSAHKEAFPGPFSRSQTLPSLAHTGAIGTAGGKVSMKFHRSPRNTSSEQSRSRSVQISPKHNYPVISSNSRDSLFRSGALDRSLSSLSIASDMGKPVVHAFLERNAMSQSQLNKVSPTGSMDKLNFVNKKEATQDDEYDTNLSESQTETQQNVVPLSHNGKNHGDCRIGPAGSSRERDHDEFIQENNIQHDSIQPTTEGGSGTVMEVTTPL